jgi:hypothetical protein
VALASAQQSMSQRATHRTAKSVPAHPVGGDSVVIKVTLHHAVQPRADDRDGLVPPPPHQRRSNCGQSRTHALLRGAANDLELTAAVRSTAVGECEKVEGLGTTLPPASTIHHGKSTQLDESCLGEIQGQSEVCETLAHGLQKALRCLLILESKQAVVRLVQNDDLTKGVFLAPLVGPQIEEVGRDES